MREIHIDLSSDYYLQQPKVFGGYVGEHNESKLIVKLPNRMIRDDISYYYFEFQTVLQEHITSPNIYKNTLSSDNEISIVLWEQLLPSAGNLKFCVNAIELGENDTVTIKGKTSVFTLHISESPTGEDVLIDSKSSKEELQKSIDSALKEAKDSGEFKGTDGYTPQKGIDYFTDEDIASLNIPSVDQTYSPTSENAQSGKAVAEAVATEQKRADNTFANALKGTKSDTAILLDDISPAPHEMGVKVRGKNLFDKSIPYEDYTFYGGGYSYLSIYVGSGSSVTVSLKQKHDIGLGGYFYCIAYKSGEVAEDSQKWLYYNTNTALCEKSVTMISEDGYVSLFMTPDAYNNFKDEIMVEIGSTATAYTPYVPDLTAVKVSRYGKNLFDINQAYNDGHSNAYDTFSINDNVITATSDNSTTKVVIMILFGGELLAGDYILSLNAVIENTPKHNRPNEIFIWKNNSVLTVIQGMEKDGSYSPKIKFTLSEKAKINISFYKNVCVSPETVSDTVYKVTFSNIQLELGSTATEYEPYITPTEYTPTADGIVEGVLNLYPNTTLMTDTEGVIIDCEYNRDINKAFAALEAAIATNNS